MNQSTFWTLYLHGKRQFLILMQGYSNALEEALKASFITSLSPHPLPTLCHVNFSIILFFSRLNSQLLPTPQALKYNTIQYNTIQYNTIQYNTIQYNTIQYNTIQYNTIQYNTIQYNTVQYNTIQYNTNTNIFIVALTP